MMRTASSGITALLTIAPSAFAAGDPGHGEGRSAMRVSSLEGLRREVRRWGKEHHSSLTRQDVDALAAWLNRNFFRFTE